MNKAVGHITPDGWQERERGQGQTSPRRLRVPKDGEKSPTATPSHTGAYVRDRNTLFRAFKSGAYCKLAFSFLFV